MSTFEHSRLTILTFESLLREQGWQVKRTNDLRTIWTRDDAGIFLPHQVDSNFDLLMSRAIGVLQDHEATNIDVGWHLEWPGWDRLQSRLTSESSIGLRESLRRQEALFDMIEAVAWSRATPDKAWFKGGNRPLSVRDYVDSARAIPSVHGSFVLRAILPLPARTQLNLLNEQEAFREFTVAIPRLILDASEAANDVQHGASADRWEEAFESSGVTANLLDSLARHLGHGSQRRLDSTVDLSLVYSIKPGERPVPERQPVVRVEMDKVDVLEAGSSYLRRDPEEQTIRSVGLVTKLERRAESGPGSITITGTFQDWDLKERSLRFELDEKTYSEAVRAHESGQRVSATVQAVRRRTRIQVIEIVDFYAIRDDTEPRKQRPEELMFPK